MTALALFGISSSLGYLLPALVGLESMGIPSPGESALILASILASQGKLSIELVILIGCSAAIIGDNIGYLIARRYGRRIFLADGPLQKRRRIMLEAGDRFFAKHGAKAVFLGRWVALLRVAAALLAGANHMPFRTFFLWNALGGITWCVTVCLVAYFAGESAVHVIEKVGVYGAVALGVALVGGLIWWKLRERRHVKELEAKSAASPAGTAE